MKRGRLIVLDGLDGAGKTTQARRLAGRLRRAGHEVVAVRDPGGTPIGEEIRRLLLDRRSSGMGLRAEVLLYMASRAQLVDEVIRPALARGAVVVADRFVTSTVAYQGFGGRGAPRDIEAVGRYVLHDLRPDLLLVLDLDPRIGRRRRSGAPDRIEARDLAYHRRVRQGFLRQARRDPRRCRVLDGAAPAAEVAAAIWREVTRVLG